MKTRILLVDDHPIYRNGLKSLIALQNDMEIVGEAENGQEAIVKTRKLHPDIILMDINMPVMTGMEATRRILAEMPDTKILALSMWSDDGNRSEMMRAGARKYLLKDGDIEELIAAIREAADSSKTSQAPH